MAARFTKPKSGKAVPVAPDYPNLAAPLTEAFPAMPKPAPKMGALDKGSAAIWNILSALGGVAKSDVMALKNNPVGSLKATLDAYTVGPEARQRFKQGDYAGAINQSGLGQLAALPEIDKVIRGKAGPMDAVWLALTYGTGPMGKALKGTKTAVKKGSTKAYIDILNRLK
jgi:hypothetical protein